MKKQTSTIIFALLFSFVIPVIGYIYLGWLIAFLFFIGYFGGFMVWLILPQNSSWSLIKTPFLFTLSVFLLLHKVEESRLKFFEVVSDKITGIPVPEITPLLIIGLLIIPVGVWIAAPMLIKRGYAFGYYLAWTFFISMGVVELAHFFLPLLTKDPYGYFPGMASVIVLAPLAWWGMYRLSRNKSNHIP